MIKQGMRKNQVDNDTSLSSAQIEAVTHGPGPMLIAAGAGSGKTRTLTQRLIYLMNNGLAPREIIAITFTNKAADEMRNRILGSPSSQKKKFRGKSVPFIGTFHSFGASILRKEAKLAGRTRAFVIFDDSDSKKIIKKILGAEDALKRYTPVKARRELSRIKNNVLNTDELDAQQGLLFEKYEDSLKKLNAFDFDDLLEKVVRIFKSNPGVLEGYQNKYSFVLVDEYQDINTSQYLILKLLCEKHRNLNVVGDDQQSIYGFRWSDFTNFLNFERDWPEAKIVNLGENYRSTSTIVRASASLIDKNKLQRRKKLWTQNENGDPIYVLGAQTAEEEANMVISSIVSRRSLENKMPGLVTESIAILYRTNAQSRAIEQALNFGSMPYKIFGGVRFYERKEIKDVVAGLRYASNPKDELSRERIAKTFKKSVAEELIKNLPRLAKELNLMELIGFILKTTNYFDYLAVKFENSEDRIDNVSELVQFATGFSSLVGFIERVALLQATDVITKKQPSHAINLMTIHLAKGLEFDNVYLIGVNEGLLPHQRSLFSEEEIEEERRLTYVAITRAKKRLHMSFYGLPSRFLGDLPPELIEFSTSDQSFDGEKTVFLD